MPQDALIGHDLERETAVRQGIAPISFELLHDLLLMPENWRIIGAQMDERSNVVNLKVEGDDLPETERGEVLPVVRGIVHKKTQTFVVEKTAQWGV